MVCGQCRWRNGTTDAFLATSGFLELALVTGGFPRFTHVILKLALQDVMIRLPPATSGLRRLFLVISRLRRLALVNELLKFAILGTHVNYLCFARGGGGRLLQRVVMDDDSESVQQVRRVSSQIDEILSNGEMRI